MSWSQIDLVIEFSKEHKLYQFVGSAICLIEIKQAWVEYIRLLLSKAVCIILCFIKGTNWYISYVGKDFSITFFLSF